MWLDTMVVCWVHVSIFEKPFGTAYDLMDVHLWKVGVRPSPVRKEVEMNTKTPGVPKIDQHIKKDFLKKRTKKGQSLVL